jgi:hypothetical protein
MDVVDGVVVHFAHFALNSGRPGEVREFGKEAVDCSADTDGLDAGSH